MGNRRHILYAEHFWYFRYSRFCNFKVKHGVKLRMQPLGLGGCMRKWYLPIAVLGLGSLGALALTERGRQVLAWLNDQFEQAPDRLLDFNDAVQRELDRIQIALDRVAESLNAA
jgi:hypothetical protein